MKWSRATALRFMSLSILVWNLTPAVTCYAEIHRSASAKAAFKRAHPCPATGQSRGACPGYVVDHIEPLCAGGPDEPDNMQWQTVEDAKGKDREERKLCRRREGQHGSDSNGTTLRETHLRSIR